MAERTWLGLQRGLERTPLDVEIRGNAFYSEPEWDMYEVRYTGLDDYRLFAWMSVPKKQGPFPGLIVMPDYTSSVSIPFYLFRFQAVVLNPSYRGQRRSDQTFKGTYPGLLTHGVENANSYIIGTIYADGIRALDLMMSFPQVAGRPIAIMGHGLGGSLGIVAAGFRPKVAALAIEAPLMISSTEVTDLASGYPLAELSDLLRMYPERRNAVMRAWESHSIVPLAGKVQCPVLLGLGSEDTGFCPLPLGKHLAGVLPKAEVRVYEGSGPEAGGYVHVVYRDTWLRNHLDLPPLYLK